MVTGVPGWHLFSQPTARALAILDLLMANPTQAFGLTEMTRRLDLNKATCHAILTTMANYGFLVQHPQTKAYRLGPSIIAAGNAAFAQFPVLEYARPELEALQSDLSIGFAVTGRSKLHQVLLALYGHATPLIDSFQLGLRLPNTAPVAACFTAFSPARELEAWLSRAHQARGVYDEKLDQKLRVSADCDPRPRLRSQPEDADRSGAARRTDAHPQFLEPAGAGGGRQQYPTRSMR